VTCPSYFSDWPLLTVTSCWPRQLQSCPADINRRPVYSVSTLQNTPHDGGDGSWAIAFPWDYCYLSWEQLRLAGRGGGWHVCRCVRSAGALYCTECRRASLPFTGRYSYTFISHKCVLTYRFRRPRGSAGARLLGLRVRIPREAWIVIVMYSSTHVHEILGGTLRCQGRDLKCGRFSIATGPVFLNTVS